MPYEVEIKFAEPDLADLRDRLTRLGAQKREIREQEDRYFNHPGRDFARTDEALRIRQDGSNTEITYKGPKVDANTKTRVEIEIALAEGASREQMADILVSLGFRPVLAVKKRREIWHCPRDQRDVEIALDEVSGLGHFVELETAADETTLPAARETLESLAAELGLSRRERRSYLEMLLAGGSE